MIVVLSRSWIKSIQTACVGVLLSGVAEAWGPATAFGQASAVDQQRAPPGVCQPGWWFLPRQWPTAWFSSSRLDAPQVAPLLKPRYRVRACHKDSAELEIEGAKAAYVRHAAGYFADFSSRIEFTPNIRLEGSARVQLQFWLEAKKVEKYLAAPLDPAVAPDLEEHINSDTTLSELPVLERKTAVGGRKSFEIVSTVLRIPSALALRRLIREEEERGPLVAIISPEMRTGSGMITNAAEGALWAMQQMQRMEANWQKLHAFAAVSVDLTREAAHLIAPGRYDTIEKVLTATQGSRLWTSWTGPRMADRRRMPTGSDAPRRPVSVVIVVVPKLSRTQHKTFIVNAGRVLGSLLSTGDGARSRIIVAHHKDLAGADEELLRAASVKAGSHDVSKVPVEEDESGRARTGFLDALKAAKPPSERTWEGLLELHKRIGALPVVPKHLTLAQLADTIDLRGGAGETAPEWINVAVSFVVNPDLVRIVHGP